MYIYMKEEKKQPEDTQKGFPLLRACMKIKRKNRLNIPILNPFTFFFMAVNDWRENSSG